MMSDSDPTIAPSDAPLLDWVLRQYPDTPKTRAKQWIQAGRVSVNGAVLRKPHLIIPNPGEGLCLLERHATTLDCAQGWHIHPRVDLLHLDSSLAVVNKGAGLLSVPAPSNDLSAMSILADYLHGKLRPRDREAARRLLPPIYRNLDPLPVHRIDQYTSGLFCMAMNPQSRERLIEQLRTHSMHRQYVAYVDGRPATPTGTWRHWVQLSADEMRQCVISESQAKAPGSNAQEAITHYEVTGEFPINGGKNIVTKLRLRLETGRKHQIRVQAAQMGLPLIGDRTYHPQYRHSASGSQIIDFPRQALHAEMLTLEHPETPGQKMTWNAPLPKDLRQLEAALHQARRQRPGAEPAPAPEKTEQS
jgi:23S rRNA pseudouridine1911/1915/1917 synthase